MLDPIGLCKVSGIFKRVLMMPIENFKFPEFLRKTSFCNRLKFEVPADFARKNFKQKYHSGDIFRGNNY
jgi:hypothetical protein